MLEAILGSDIAINFMGFMASLGISFVFGVLVDRGILSKDTKNNIRRMKRAALKEYVETAEDSQLRGIIEAYLEREDTSISKKDVEVKN